jgi:NTP pyrophosphatase (non-canonical NTP hydrolase)
MELIDNEKLQKLAKEIYEIAVAHGWHEDTKPNGLWMALVVSEVAEAIEADRKNKHANVSFFLDQPLETDTAFKSHYEGCIKGSIEEELADIVIRLLDYINMRWSDKYDWWYNPHSFRIPDDFPVAAWKLVKEHLNEGSMNVRDSIQYVLECAEKLNIDIEQHIKWKMRYNSLRPYKHGGKKY